MEYTESLRTDGLPSSLDEAKKRMRDGYVLPAFPSTDDVSSVEFGVFTKGCTAILKQRTNDLASCRERQHEYRMASDAAISFNVAVVAKDVDMIRVFHSLVLKAESPRNLAWCAKLIRQMHPDTPVASIITEQHVQAVTAIKEAVWEWDEDVDSSPDMHDLIGGMAKLALEDLTQTDRIVTLIKRGIFNRDKMREQLKDIADIESPLVEGTL